MYIILYIYIPAKRSSSAFASASNSSFDFFLAIVFLYVVILKKVWDFQRAHVFLEPYDLNNNNIKNEISNIIIRVIFYNKSYISWTTIKYKK